MAPIKFEEHVKEKLDEREIQPSAASWNKLSSRLDDSNKGAGRKLWISSIAAVVIVIIASTIFIDQQDQNYIPVANTPAEEVMDNQENENPVKDPVQITSEEKLEKVDMDIERSEIINSRPGLNEEKLAERTNPIDADKVEEAKAKPLLNRQFIEPVTIKSSVIAENSSDQLSVKVQEVLARITNEENRSGDLTSAEVDALLAEAASEISREKILYKRGTITADVLLADVEYEVDQSFRKEVFDFLKEEFLKAKTAVATRNE